MNYISEYKPADKVISTIVAIPMGVDMCYLIPWKAMQKIPECREKIDIESEGQNRSKDNSFLNKRSREQNKRAILQLISLAIGITSSIFSAISTIQTTNL
jgi:hypothetical protein